MADDLPEYNALGGRHCGTCAKFHVPKDRPNKAIGYCVAHPPQVQAHYLFIAPAPKPRNVLVADQAPPEFTQGQSVLLRVQSFMPQQADEDGCWEHVRRE